MSKQEIIPVDKTSAVDTMTGYAQYDFSMPTKPKNIPGAGDKRKQKWVAGRGNANDKEILEKLKDADCITTATPKKVAAKKAVSRTNQKKAK